MVKKGYQSPYVQLKRQGSNQTWRSVNYSKITWQTLTGKFADIDGSLKHERSYSTDLGRGFNVTVKPHEASGLWYVCLLKSLKENLVPGKCINLNAKEWCQLGEHWHSVTTQLDEYSTGITASRSPEDST